MRFGGKGVDGGSGRGIGLKYLLSVVFPWNRRKSKGRDIDLRRSRIHHSKFVSRWSLAVTCLASGKEHKPAPDLG